MGIYIYTHTYTYSLDPSSSWAQTLRLPSSCPWIPVSPSASTWRYKPPRLQPQFSCYYRPSHSHRKLSGTPLVSPSLLWSCPQRLTHPLAHRPCHLLAGLSTSTFTSDHRLAPTSTLTPVAAPRTRGPHDSWSHSSCCTQSAAPPHMHTECLSSRKRGFKRGLK